MAISMKAHLSRALGTRTRTARVLVALAFAGIYTAACDVHGVSEPGAVSSLSISPNPQTLAVTGTQQFTATGKDFSGANVVVNPVWSVVAGGGTISATGLFTAGMTTSTYANTVKAVSGALSSTATVIVINGPLSTITVTPNPMSMPSGSTQQYTAVGKDVAGNVVPLTPVWSVAQGGGATSNSGLFTAGGSTGTFTNSVTATSGSISGNATVTVTAALASITVTPNPASLLTNSQQQFAATGRDVNGNVVSISPVWSVINGGGSIASSSGLFTSGGTAGTFSNTVSAAVGSVSGTATVNVSSTAPAPIVNLGAAAPNGIMAGTAFTCVIGGTINADIAISPGSTVTGFPPCVITGTQHLADALAAQAQIDLTNAYNTLAGLPCAPANNIGTSDIGGTTKAAGVYCSATSIGVTGQLTLDGGGDPNATFVFQAGSGLTTAGNVVLINGAQAKNVYWQIGSSATIGTGSQWQGNILALTSITLVDNANLTGRALARNGAVSLGTNNTITLP